MTQTLPARTADAPPIARRSPLALIVGDCRTLARRSLTHSLRSPEQWIQTFSIPIVTLLIFRYLLGGAIMTDNQTYINYVVAGLIAISIGFNLTSTVIGVTDDLRNGIVERFRSMPVPPWAVLVAHLVVAVVRNLTSAVVLIVAGYIVGFRPNATAVEWLAALGLLLLFVTAFSWVAVILGVWAKSVEGGNGLGMILVFVPYVSSALVPTSTMPAGLRAVVENQPVSPVVDTIRGLLAGSPVGNAGWLAVIWWSVILVVAMPVAARMFRRRASA